MRKSEFIESINLGWKLRISARNCDYEIKKLQVQLTDTQKKAARHVIKKVKQSELQQPVLFALAYYMAQNKVKSSVAYLNGLVTRANNGTFEAVQSTGATKQTKPLIPYWHGHKPTEKVDNDSYFQELINKFGSKAAAAIPAGITAL